MPFLLATSNFHQTLTDLHKFDVAKIEGFGAFQIRMSVGVTTTLTCLY